MSFSSVTCLCQFLFIHAHVSLHVARVGSVADLLQIKHNGLQELEVDAIVDLREHVFYILPCLRRTYELLENFLEEPSKHCTVYLLAFFKVNEKDLMYATDEKLLLVYCCWLWEEEEDEVLRKHLVLLRGAFLYFQQKGAEERRVVSQQVE